MSLSKPRRSGPDARAALEAAVYSKHGVLSRLEQLDLADIAKDMIASLPERAVQNFEEAMTHVFETDDEQVVVGTMCSGSDMPVFSLKALFKAAAAVFLLGSSENVFKHLFAVEKDPAKQAWLTLVNECGTQLFEDVKKMARSFGWCLSSKKYVKILRCTILIAGWSCVDASMLNTKRDEFTGSIGTDPNHGTTSSTFHGVLDYIKIHLPQIFLGENVVQILSRSRLPDGLVDLAMLSPEERASNGCSAIDLLRGVGYSAVFMILSATSFGLPQARRRLCPRLNWHCMGCVLRDSASWYPQCYYL